MGIGLLEAGANCGRVLVRPHEWELAALLRFDVMDEAVSRLIEETAGAIRFVDEDKPAPVSAQRGIALRERPDIHAETMGQGSWFSRTEMNESGDAATGSALLAYEVLARELIHGVRGLGLG